MDKAFAIRRAIYAIQARGGEWGMPISRMGSGESGGKTQAAESAHPEAISKRPDARRLAVHPGFPWKRRYPNLCQLQELSALLINWLTVIKLSVASKKNK